VIESLTARGFCVANLNPSGTEVQPGANAAGNEIAVSAYSQMDTKKNQPLPSKIDQLVDDAKTELNRVGIETEGKRSDEILKMAREERNKPRVA
jgi:hypothetical protein